MGPRGSAGAPRAASGQEEALAASPGSAGPRPRQFLQDPQRNLIKAGADAAGSAAFSSLVPIRLTETPQLPPEPGRDDESPGSDSLLPAPLPAPRPAQGVGSTERGWAGTGRRSPRDECVRQDRAACGEGPGLPHSLCPSVGLCQWGLTGTAKGMC